MAEFRFVRLVRTVSSEVYLIWVGDRRVGQVGLHYADGSIHADLLLETDVDPKDLQDLYSQIDDDIVSSYLPSFDREQFILTVFRGEEVDSFNYPPGSEEPEEEP